MRIVAALTRLRTLVLAAGVVGVLVVGFSMVPRGLPLQLAFTSGEFDRAWLEWAAELKTSRLGRYDARTVFMVATAADFLFIPAYASLLAAIYLRLRRIRVVRPEGGSLGWTDRAVLASCGAAALLDVVENVGLLSLTAAGKPASPLLVRATSSASALKWACIALVAIFIVRAFVAGARGRVLWLSRYTVLSMALGTVPLVAASQGQDLIVALADSHASYEHRAFFYLALTIWGLSVWYWTRVVLDAELGAEAGASYEGIARHLPRVLGAATLLLPAVPIAFAANKLWVRAAMIAGCVALALLFWIFVARRRYSGLAAAGPAVADFSVRGAAGTPAASIAAVSLLVSLGMFALFVFAPLTAGQHLGAVAILFIAAANTVFFGSLAVFASEASGIRIDIVALACAAAFSFWNDNHDVFVQPLDRPLPTLNEQFRAWLSERPAGVRRPVFLVAAEGGGIRAAYWTATVLGGLNAPETVNFPTHLFAVSGVSGGTLGAAVYAALRHDFPTDGTSIAARAQSILSRDFLSPTLAKLVSGDFLQWFLPLPVHAFDRSAAIEEAFRRAYENEARADTLGGPITTLMPDGARGVPALVMNTTDVESGATAIIAPFTWTKAQIPLAIGYTCWTGDCRSRPAVFAAPTLVRSIHNSARFTYVSPAGLVRNIANANMGHVVDAGYFDPTGAETLLDLARALRQVEPDVDFVPIYVTNSTVRSDINTIALAASIPRDPQSVQRAATVANATAEPVAGSEDAAKAAPVELLGEIFAPVRALLGSRNAHGRLAVARQRAGASAITFGFCQPASTEPEEKLPEPPLGWQLSPQMTARLQAYWENCPANQAGRRAVQNWLDQPAAGTPSR